MSQIDAKGDISNAGPAATSVLDEDERLIFQELTAKMGGSNPTLTERQQPAP